MDIVGVIVTVIAVIATVVATKIVESVGQWFIVNMIEPFGELLIEKVVKPAGQWLDYLFHYSRNIENMKDQVAKLQAVKEGSQHFIDAGNREEIKADVNMWSENVDVIMGMVREVLEDEAKAKKKCSYTICVNFLLRYQLSKKAKKIVEDIDEVLKNGGFDKDFYMDYMNFKSRLSIVNELKVALGDANINVIGVWGMAGVGKTTLVREVARQVMKEKLFEDMAMVAVMQSPDLKRIQGEIAEMLGLKLDVETVPVRAIRLQERLAKDKKVLVILDDIWEKIDLEDIGIPRNKCKVVFTSRNRDLLSSEMSMQKDFGLGVLSEREAWSLFVKMVGDSLKDPNLQSIATQVCEECAGLPIALVTVATALKNKKLFEWKDALQQLRRPSPVHLTGMQATIYSKIKLSYKHLGSPVVKSFFLLCGQMGFTIFYDDLIKYCFGLCLFQDISTLEEVRDRVYTLVRSLKDSCLLLEDPHTSEYVRMHDLVRDVAILIAKAENVLLMRNDDPIKWPDEDARKICTAISVFSRDIHELPDRFECPKLRLLYVHGKDRYFKISDTFFKGMSELKVLDLTKMRLSSLPSSINLLTNLQTLCLDQCLLGDIAMIGELKSLEILSLLSSEFKQLPREIGNLTRLRLLDLSNCTKLEVIPPNVLSCLIRLEELFVGNSFTQWEVEGLNNERASLAELKHLSQLTTLELHIPDAKILPKDLTVKLKLNTSFQLGREIKMLLNGIEDLCLDELKGVESIIYELDTEGFQQLKHLHVQNNVEIKYVINSRGLVIDDVAFPSLEIFSLKNMINLEEICHGKLPLASFRNIRVVKVEHCDKLKFVFTSSIAKGLSQLQELEIRECSIMGAIVIKEEGELKTEI
uniref:AAA+ ATPase domain-containing protein n=1 Tax=Fagus sylvatica TaxID=28930 RepID=A0A2N9GY71_FAGSY